MLSARFGPMPLIMPEAKYFSMPSAVVGGAARSKSAQNCTLRVRSLTHRPLAWTNSPAPIAAAWPTTVIRSRWPRAFTRRTQKPAVLVVKGDALDEAGEVILCGWSRRPA
jgi:hypothetical protein